MEYINPTSVAGMFNQPKDTSLPGAGYGLTQGFLEGQAAARSMDFLDQSQAAQAQDFVKQQFDMQKAWQDRPFEIQKRNAEFEGTQLENTKKRLTNEQLTAAAEKIKREGKMDSISAFGAAHPIFAAAKGKSALEKKMIWEDYVKRHQFSGLPADESLIWDGTEEGWDSIINSSAISREIASFHNQLAAQNRITEKKEEGDDWRTNQTNATRIRIEEMSNEAAKVIAQIKAQADRDTAGGGNALNAEKVRLIRSLEQIQAKVNREGANSLTAEEKATLQWGPIVLSQGYMSTESKLDPKKVQDAARAKSAGDLEGIVKALEGGPEIKGEPLPEKEQDLRDRLNRYK